MLDLNSDPTKLPFLCLTKMKPSPTLAAQLFFVWHDIQHKGLICDINDIQHKNTTSSAIMLNVVIYLLLCWVSLCHVSLRHFVCVDPLPLHKSIRAAWKNSSGISSILFCPTITDKEKSLCFYFKPDRPGAGLRLEEPFLWRARPRPRLHDGGRH